VKKQKFDREDARLLLRLLRENNFPQIWIADPENRDLRQLLWHRHRLVQMRTRIMNQLQALAMNEGYRWKKKLFSETGRAPGRNVRSCFRAPMVLEAIHENRCAPYWHRTPDRAVVDYLGRAWRSLTPVFWLIVAGTVDRAKHSLV
jgi:transposase